MHRGSLVMDVTHKLIAVRNDGTVIEREFRGWHGESTSDRLFTEMKEDRRTIFATTIGICSDGSYFTRQFYSEKPAE
jgi:hypothetical protein